MENLYYLITIVNRESADSYLHFFDKNKISVLWGALCTGTASQNILDYLGIEKTEKIAYHSVVTQSSKDKLLRYMIYYMGINQPGNGISLAVKLQSMGGESAMNYFIKGQQNNNESEEPKMADNSGCEYSLIVIISEKGSSDAVMEAARSGGAGGGTLIHAKGTGTKFTAKFFGMSLADEKDMIYIVSKKSDKNGIMKSVMEKAGMDSDAHAVVFSLPVDSVAGLRMFDEPQ